MSSTGGSQRASEINSAMLNVPGYADDTMLFMMRWGSLAQVCMTSFSLVSLVFVFIFFPSASHSFVHFFFMFILFHHKPTQNEAPISIILHWQLHRKVRHLTHLGSFAAFGLDWMVMTGCGDHLIPHPPRRQNTHSVT